MYAINALSHIQIREQIGMKGRLLAAEEVVRVRRNESDLRCGKTRRCASESEEAVVLRLEAIRDKVKVVRQPTGSSNAFRKSRQALGLVARSAWRRDRKMRRVEVQW